MKRIFLDMYLAHNLGDDLFLHIIANRYQNCKFTINYYNNDYNSFLKKYKNIQTKVTLKNRIIRKLGIKDYINNIEDISEQHDVLVFLSGSYFMERYCGEYEFNRRKELIDAFKKKNKPVYILGSNFGPYSSKNFYDKWQEEFLKCDDICFREEYSYNLFKTIENTRVANDVVLGLDISKYKHIGEKNIVGFSIIDVRKKIGKEHFYDSYINSTVKSIKMFINKGYECVLMSFCEIEGDLEVINDIINLLSENEKSKIKVYEYKEDLEEAISLIKSFKIFIAARFHANILGLLLNICTIPIIYSNKTTNVLNDLKLHNIAIKMEDLNLIYNEEYIELRLKEGNMLDKEFLKNNNQFDKLDKLLK